VQLLFGAEVGEQAALADAEVVGQALQRDGVQALRRADPRGVVEDGLAGLQAPDPAPVRWLGRLGDRHLPLDISTTGRLLLALNDRSCY